MLVVVKATRSSSASNSRRRLPRPSSCNEGSFACPTLVPPLGKRASAFGEKRGQYAARFAKG